MTKRFKIISTIVLAGFFVTMGMTAFLSSLVDDVDGNCAPGTMCARPWRKVVTPYFSFEAPSISHEQFDGARNGIVALSILGHIIAIAGLVVVLNKTESK